MAKILLYSHLLFLVFVTLKWTQSEKKIKLPVSISEIPND